jgi:hypothetical protein
MFWLFWQFLILSGSLRTLAPDFLSQWSASLLFLVSMILVPLFVLINMIIVSGIIHLMLLLTRGANRDFGSTLVVVSYGQAVQLLAVLPFVGGFIGSFWFLVIQIIGLREMHETTFLRVILAFLIPLGLAVLLVIAAVIISLLFFV